MFKCLPRDLGVDVSLNSSSFFTFTSLTHLCIDLGNNKIRLERKIDGLREVYTSDVTDYTHLDGTVISTNWAGLNAYLNQRQGDIKAGEGISVQSGTVSVTAGGPATLGGFRVGNGLMVDGTGRLSATAVSEVTKVLSTEAEMLGQSTETLRPYRVIRLDTKRLYYLNAGESPAVLSNWFVGPSIEAAVVSFKGRTGVVVPEFADYNADQVPLIDKTTAVNHRLVIDDGKLYVENIDTSVRKELSIAGDIATLQTQVTALSDTVNNASTGLVKRVTTLETETSRLTNVVSNATSGLEKRVETLETTPKADLVAGKVPMEQLPPLGMSAAQAQRLTDVEASALLANQKGDSASSNILAVDTRLTQVSDREATNNTATNSRVSTLDNRVTTLNTARVADISALQSGKINTSEKAAVNGIAPLGADGKVPTAHLPETASAVIRQLFSYTSSQRLRDVTYTNDTGYEIELFVQSTASTSTGFISVVVSVGQPDQVVIDSGNIGTATGHRQSVTAVVPAGKTYRVTGRDPDKWVELRRVSGSSTPLGNGGRIWRDNKRAYNTWVTNDSGNDMELYIRTNAISDINAYININLRSGPSGSTMTFASTAESVSGNRYMTHQVTVPAGWQYGVAIAGGGSFNIGHIGIWRELS